MNFNIGERIVIGHSDKPRKYDAKTEAERNMADSRAYEAMIQQHKGIEELKHESVGVAEGQ